MPRRPNTRRRRSPRSSLLTSACAVPWSPFSVRCLKSLRSNDREAKIASIMPIAEVDFQHWPPEKLSSFPEPLGSRKAAVVNSQGRKPLDWIILEEQAPRGRQMDASALPPRWGLTTEICKSSRGLHPWLLTAGPLGLEDTG